MSQEVGIVTLKKNTTTYKCIIQVRYHPCHWPFFRFWVPETSLLTKDLSYFCQKVVVMLHYGWPSMAATIQPKSLDCIEGCQTRGECDDPCTVFFGSTPMMQSLVANGSVFFGLGIPDPKFFSCHPDGDWVTIPSLGEGWTEILNNITYCRSNYGDSHDRFPPNGGLVREILLFRGKSRLVK